MSAHRRRLPPSGPGGPLRWAAHRGLATGVVPTLTEVRDARARRRGGPRAERVEVFAVEDTSIQVSWGALGPGPVTLRAGDTAVEVDSDGGPGAVSLDGLPADRQLVVHVDGEGAPAGGVRLPTRTLAPPPGEALGRIATVSDLHVGATTFGYLHTISDDDLADPHPLRCARAAVAEAAAWGASRIVAKGDLVDQPHPGAWEAAATVLAGAPVPVDVVPGNHETKRRRTIEPETALAHHGLHLVRGMEVADLPGVRLVLLDTTRAGDDRGRLEHVADDLVDALVDAPGGALVAMHHHVQRAPLPVGWPLGIPRAEAMAVLDRVAAVAPGTFITSGHVHRNRRWHHGGVVLTTVGSVKDYPGVWGGYVVHEGGIRQVVRRIVAPTAIRWTERTGDALGGAYRRWTPGRLSDRCFTWTWPKM